MRLDDLLVVLTTPLRGGCGTVLAVFALLWWAYYLFGGSR